MWVSGAQVASAAQVFSSPRRRGPNPGKNPSESANQNQAPTSTRAPAAARNAPAKGPTRAPSKPPLSTGGAGHTAEEEASASALAQWRRSARGQRAGQPAVRQRNACRTVAGRRAQLPQLGLRGRTGADGRLRVRRAHQHRRDGWGNDAVRIGAERSPSVGGCCSWRSCTGDRDARVVPTRSTCSNSPAMREWRRGCETPRRRSPSRGSCWRWRSRRCWRYTTGSCAGRCRETLGQVLLMGVMMPAGCG